MALPKAIADQLGKPPQPLRALHEVIPPLENGDRLTRAEFERRYQAMPEHTQAELIEGVVYMSSPVRHKKHGKPHRRLVALLSTYSDLTPGTDCSDNATVLLDFENEPQPDISLFIEAEAGGNTRLTSDDYIAGAPELAVEIAASTASIDLNAKLEAYQRNGVKEYLVWRVADGAFDWFELVQERFVPVAPDRRGIIRSRVFPGLWLNVKALLKGEMKKVQAVLQQGLAAPEHAAFVKQLKAARKRQPKH
jgi:Uma2 family endonuclease